MRERVPDDVVEDILGHLPVKSLIRFRCVSKAWDSTITDPTFITKHLKLKLNQSESLISTNTHSGYLLYTENISPSTKHLCTVVCNSDRTLTQISRFEVPSLSSKYSIVGFCNGLFCLASLEISYSHFIYLWNPSIRKLKRLVVDNKMYRTSVVGLAYISQNNDFKIVRLLEGPAEAEIYSLSKDSDVIRKKILTGYEANFGTIDKLEPPCIFLNGALHTVANTSRGRFILSFDVNDESFNEIMLPFNYLDVVTKSQLALFKGSLAVSTFTDGLRGAQCNIWVMEEYGVAQSWTIKYTVPRKWGIVNFYGCTGNGELLIKNDLGLLVSIDLESQSQKFPAIEGADWVGSTTNLMESLILLNGGFEGRQLGELTLYNVFW